MRVPTLRKADFDDGGGDDDGGLRVNWTLNRVRDDPCDWFFYVDSACNEKNNQS